MVQDRRHAGEQNSKVLKEMLTRTVDAVSVRVTSTPAGQYGLQKIDDILRALAEAADWSTIGTDNNNYEDALQRNGHSEKDLTEHSGSRPSWIIFIPLILMLSSARMVVNGVRLIFGLPLLGSQQIRWLIIKWRIHVKYLQSSGSRNIRKEQRITARRLRKHPPELNVICRTFSKWPLRLFVKRLRKILNFLGIITLPLPRDLKKNNEESRKIAVRNQNPHKTHEEDSRWEVHSSSDYETDESSDNNECELDSEESAETEEETVSARRVSVTVQEVIVEETVQEVIIEETTEEALNILKDYSNSVKESADMPCPIKVESDERIKEIKTGNIVSNQ